MTAGRLNVTLGAFVNGQQEDEFFSTDLSGLNAPAKSCTLQLATKTREWVLECKAAKANIPMTTFNPKPDCCPVSEGLHYPASAPAQPGRRRAPRADPTRPAHTTPYHHRDTPSQLEVEVHRPQADADAVQLPGDGAGDGHVCGRPVGPVRAAPRREEPPPCPSASPARVFPSLQQQQQQQRWSGSRGRRPPVSLPPALLRPLHALAGRPPVRPPPQSVFRPTDHFRIRQGFYCSPISSRRRVYNCNPKQIIC